MSTPAWHCALWGLPAATPANDDDLALMRRIDELFTAWPFLGSRRMTAMLKAEGPQVNRKHVQRLMRKMGIAALGPRPNTTRPAPGHKDLSLSVAQHDDHPAKPGVGGSSNPNRTLSRRTGIGPSMSQMADPAIKQSM